VVVMASAPVHLPVLLEEATTLLSPQAGATFIDATVGLGGHAARIAEAIGPDGRLLCIDREPQALEAARQRLSLFGRRLSFARADFREIATVARDHGFERVDGILMDLGVSSLQLDTAARGFSFGREGPLDMRMDQAHEGTSAATIVNTWDEAALADAFFRYGEEPRARRIAAAIVRQRPLATTWDLARTVEQAVGRAGGQTRTHPATRVFLALRILVNGELDSFHEALPLACGLLNPGTRDREGGRIAVIAFHSLEDRIVKDFFRRESTDCLCPPQFPVCRCGHRATLRLLTRRAVRPGPEEVARNPRARSAVLRAAARIGG
jgi:16S rRNA (cytosine1402-N4)-methyltransferase